MLGGFLSSLGGAGGIARFSADGDDIIVGDSDTTFHADADDNIAIGANALDSTSGAALGNIAIGTSALTANTTSDYCIAIGYQALIVSIDERNIGIGGIAGSGITNAYDNIAIGYSTMITAAGNRNTVVGSYAGKQLTAGTDNVLIGYNAGQELNQNTPCIRNTVVGAWAMNGGNINSDYSVAIGYKAMSGVLDAIDGAVAIGYQALNALTTGNGNMAIGYNAMLTHTTGIRNIAIGYGAMDDTDGSANVLASEDNIFIGYDSGGGTWAFSAGGTADDSDRNVAIGNYTMDAAMDDANDNVAVGHNALTELTSGDYNVVVGSSTGKFITTGSGNTYFGTNAGLGITGAKLTGDNNTAVGKDAGNSLQGAAHSNTVVGKNAGQNITTGSSNTVVGFGADVDAATDSGITRLGYYGAIKYITNRITCSHAHDGDNTIVREVCKIPARSIIKSVSVVIQTLSNIANYNLNLSLSTTSGSSADDALVNASTTITVPEILGADAAATYARDSATAMGTSNAINADNTLSSGIVNYCYYNEPTTTIVGTADTYLYVCNDGTGNGTVSLSTPAVLEIVVGYIGID